MGAPPATSSLCAEFFQPKTDGTDLCHPRPDRGSERSGPLVPEELKGDKEWEERPDPAWEPRAALEIWPSAWGEALPGAREAVCASGASARHAPFIPHRPSHPPMLVFIFSEWSAASCRAACVFAKFVTNFLFGFGLRLEALCVLKLGHSQKSSASLSAATGREAVSLPSAGFCHPLQPFWLGNAL